MMLTHAQARRLHRFANGGDFDTDAQFFEALKELETVEELYYLVQVLNWDDYRTPNALEWILEHPKCDAGTALQIYWMNDPEGLKEVELKHGGIPAWAQDTHELQKKIERLYLAGRFPAGQIAFDPRKQRYLAESPARDSGAANAIPSGLKTATTGMDLGEFFDQY
jgi:hypothetical protein